MSSTEHTIKHLYLFSFCNCVLPLKTLTYHLRDASESGLYENLIGIFKIQWLDIIGLFHHDSFCCWWLGLCLLSSFICLANIQLVPYFLVCFYSPNLCFAVRFLFFRCLILSFISLSRFLCQSKIFYLMRSRIIRVVFFCIIIFTSFLFIYRF